MSQPLLCSIGAGLGRTGRRGQLSRGGRAGAALACQANWSIIARGQIQHSDQYECNFNVQIDGLC